MIAGLRRLATVCLGTVALATAAPTDIRITPVVADGQVSVSFAAPDAIDAEARALVQSGLLMTLTFTVDLREPSAAWFDRNVAQAVVASSFGLRFQGQGYFLTDARTHRGTSGAPVVLRRFGPNVPPGDLPWMLLGVHSARLDVGTRDLNLDEALGLNCAWYADILLTLTRNSAG